jgi:hypothetical protein
MVRRFVLHWKQVAILMDKTWTMKPTADEAAELEAEIKRMFAEMEQADVRIKRLQDETDKLRAETRAILATLRAK